MLGLGPGEAHVIRNAGGVVTDDVIRSLVVSQRLLDTREIILLHHTDCGSAEGHRRRAEGRDRGRDRGPPVVGAGRVQGPLPGRSPVDPPPAAQPVHPAQGPHPRLRVRGRHDGRLVEATATDRRRDARTSVQPNSEAWPSPRQATGLESARMAMTLTPDTRDPELDELHVRRPAADRAGQRRRSRTTRTAAVRLAARPAGRPALGPSGAVRPAGRHRGALPVGPRRVRLGQLVLLGRGPGRLAELEGAVLRIERRRNFITVDKPPASLWIMGLSVRLFGLSSWSILVPEALMGVACVGVLYATVKRWFGAGGRPARRRGAGADPGGHADVPVQQPRRDARARPDLRGVLHHPGPRGRPRHGGCTSASPWSASAS